MTVRRSLYINVVAPPLRALQPECRSPGFQLGTLGKFVSCNHDAGSAVVRGCECSLSQPRSLFSAPLACHSHQSAPPARPFVRSATHPTHLSITYLLLILICLSHIMSMIFRRTVGLLVRSNDIGEYVRVVHSESDSERAWNTTTHRKTNVATHN